jgi:hypothetical protein
VVMHKNFRIYFLSVGHAVGRIHMHNSLCFHKQVLLLHGFHVIATDLWGYTMFSKLLYVASYACQPLLSDIVCIFEYFGVGKTAIVVSYLFTCVLLIFCLTTWFSLQILKFFRVSPL